MRKNHEEEYFTKEEVHSAEIAMNLQLWRKKETIEYLQELKIKYRQKSDDSPKKNEERRMKKMLVTQDHPSISRTL